MNMLELGVGFFPTDEILVGNYLANKNNEEIQVFINGPNFIVEFDLYDYDPFMLPYTLFHYPNVNRWEFYCFTKKIDEERRHCKSGFWMKKGNVRDITSASNVILGKKTLFIFYVGNSVKTASKTNWIMYEYALADKPHAPFVVCCVFDSHPGMGVDVDSEFGAISDVDDDPEGASVLHRF